MPSSDRPTPPALDTPPSPLQPLAKHTAPREWHPWLIAQLVRHAYAAQSERTPGKIRFYLLALERDIARLLPDAPVAMDTLRNVVYRHALPSHPTARGLAAALHVSEIAILLRSGQLDWDAVTPLLGDVPAILRSEAEYRAARQRLAAEVADPAFRARLASLLDREWQASQRLEARLRWLGISAEEWERIRRDLNSPDGRLRLVRALYGPDATPQDDLSAVDIPREFLDAADDASMDV